MLLDQSDQWLRHTRACQGKCPGRNSSALAAKSGNNKNVYQDILTALNDVTYNLPMPCHDQRTGAATACDCGRLQISDVTRR